jgi:hypothetical protein
MKKGCIFILRLFHISDRMSKEIMLFTKGHYRGSATCILLTLFVKCANYPLDKAQESVYIIGR